MKKSRKISENGWPYGKKKKKTRQGNGRYTKRPRKGSKHYKKPYRGQGK